MEIKANLYPFWESRKGLIIACEKVRVLRDVCFCGKSIAKSKVLTWQNRESCKCLKVEESILQASHFERVAPFAAESELRFLITYTTFKLKCSQFCTCGKLCMPI
jgi:hypothetical protein